MAEIIKITLPNGDRYFLDLGNIEWWDYFGYGTTLVLTIREVDSSQKVIHNGKDAVEIYNKWLKESSIPGKSWKSPQSNENIDNDDQDGLEDYLEGISP